MFLAPNQLITSGLLLCLCLSTLGTAVEKSDPTKVLKPRRVYPKEQLKVYVSPDKTVFWPIDLPFYVKLAVAPEDGSQAFLLQQIETKNLSETGVSINEGVKLDIPGSQFVRWMNHISNQEVMFKFVADGEPPITSLKFSNAPRFSNGNATYYGKGLIAEVISTDEHSGVKETQYKINELPIKTYQNPLYLNIEQPYILRHRAIDNVGYGSDELNESFIVDLSAPETKSSVQNNFEGSILSQQSVVKLEANDSLAGVNAIFYKFNDDKDYKKYDPKVGIDVASLNDGSQILKYFAKDEVENKELPRELFFELDKTAPNVAYTFSGDYFITDKTRYISQRTRIKLDASDSHVSVRKILFAVNEDKDSLYSVPFTPSVKQGELKLFYSAIDSLSNQSARQSATIIMDTDAPKSNHSIEGPHFKNQNGVVYLSENASISVVSNDNLSGISNIQYQLNEKSPESYRKPFTLPEEGRFLFRYWATDNVNNQEVYSPILMILDKSPPEIVQSYSSDSIGQQKSHGETIPVYPIGTAVTISARDSSSGVENIRYSLDSKTWLDYKEKILFSQIGKFKLELRSTDRVGNQSKKTLNFEVADPQWNSIAH